MSEKKESKWVRFLGSYRGKVLFNFFYGFGAAAAILGTLFKILHLDGANVMLAVGLGTEVLMFAISAFEPPYRNYHWEEVFPVLKTGDPADRPNFYGPALPSDGIVVPQMPSSPIVVGSTPVASPVATDTPPPIEAPITSGESTAPMGGGTIIINGNMPSGTFEMPQMPQINLSEADNQSLENSVKEYIEQMNTMNLHLRGLNTIYEIQLKSISSQIDTIDRINQSLLNIKGMYEGSTNDSERFLSETEAMASNLSNLNQIYGRMLQAMMSGAPFGGVSPTPEKPMQDNL